MPPSIIRVLLVLPLTACFSWQAVGPTPAQYVESRHPATVQVTLSSGERLRLVDPVIAGDSLAGSHRPSAGASGPLQRVVVPLADVTAMTAPRLNAGRTTALVGLSVFTIAALITIANGLDVGGGALGY